MPIEEQRPLWADSEGEVPREPLAGVEGLKALDWSFDGSTSRPFTHDLHPWPAKFIPDIPRAAIEALTQPGDVVLDPFCGCGTTALEAMIVGRRVVAFDVNPLAAMITHGKCHAPLAAERRRIALWADELTACAPTAELLDLAPEIPNRSYWFDDAVIAQLAYLRRGIESLDVTSSFLRTVLSSIIVRCSRQESETRYRRVDRPRTAEWVLDEFRKRLWRALSMAQRLEEAEPIRDIQVGVADARILDTKVARGTVDLAVFSPPYPNAFDYHLYHRFRMFWMGFDPRIVKHSEIGAHLRYEPPQRWVDDMERFAKALYSVIRPGGYVVCVVGDGLSKGELIPSGDLFMKTVLDAGFSGEFRCERQVARARRSFNLSDSPQRNEHVLVFRR